MPDAFKNYIKFVEEQIGVPISILSVGPNRTQTIILEEVVD
jgi:adenylosuccinate synthase